jgi:hypothetical protein
MGTALRHCGTALRHCGPELRHCCPEPRHCCPALRHCGTALRHCCPALRHCNRQFGITCRTDSNAPNIRATSVVAVISFSETRRNHKGPNQASNEVGAPQPHLWWSKNCCNGEQVQAGALPRWIKLSLFPPSFGTFSANLLPQTLQKLPVVMLSARTNSWWTVLTARDSSSHSFLIVFTNVSFISSCSQAFFFLICHDFEEFWLPFLLFFLSATAFYVWPQLPSQQTPIVFCPNLLFSNFSHSYSSSPIRHHPSTFIYVFLFSPSSWFAFQ